MATSDNGTSLRDQVFARAHLGLPDDSPWIFRVPLRSRAFLAVTVTITLVLGLVIAYAPQWLLWLDEPVSGWVRSLVDDGRVARIVTLLGSPNLSLVIGVVAVAVLWRWCRASAVTMGALIASAFVVDLALKVVVDRPRPPNSLVGTALGSFPSGHVIHAVVLFGLVPMLLWVVTNRRSLLRFGFVVFTVGVSAVAISRVSLGAHWPSDVIVSMFIGLSLLLSAEKLLTSSWPAGRCTAASHHPSHDYQESGADSRNILRESAPDS
jgi:undecaprenyl-diphosphatase